MKKMLFLVFCLISMLIFSNSDKKIKQYKSLEVDVVGVEIHYGPDTFGEKVDKEIHLKVTDFKLTDLNGNVYTKNNYPNKKGKEFIPKIITDDYINHYFLNSQFEEINKPLKIIGTEKKDKKLDITTLELTPTKMIFNENICVTDDREEIYYSFKYFSHEGECKE